MTWVLLLGVLIFSFFLIKSADQVVIAVHRLSRNSGSVAFTISAIFLAIATSLPELFIGVSSGLGGVSSLSLGNVVGANIANITLVAGVATLLMGQIDVHQRFVRKEVFIALLAGILPFILVFIDGNLIKLDGAILIGAYFVYVFSFFRHRLTHITDNLRERHFFYKTFRRIQHVDSHKLKEILRLILGIVFLLISSNLLVFVAKLLAINLGVPVFLVGLIILSIGTTLPELAFSIKALGEHEPTMFFGNILGSIIVNSTLITGIAIFLSPIENFIFDKYALAAIAFVIIYLLFWMFTRSKMKFDRWEAGVLVFIYAVFVVVEFL